MSTHPPIPIQPVLAAMSDFEPEFALAVAAKLAPALWQEWMRGMAVVPLPEPDGDIDTGDEYVVFAAGEAGRPKVHFDVTDEDGEELCLSWSADLAERVGAALIANARRSRAGCAADRAEQLAAEQAKAVTDAQ